MNIFSEQQIRTKWNEFLNETADNIKGKRLEAIALSSDRKSVKTERYEFNFKYYEYKVDHGEYPVHPSAELDNEFELTVTTNRGNLETIFTYICSIKDRLNSSANSNISFAIKDLKDFEAFINDEPVKLDKGTAKKISSNLKIDDKQIKIEFKNNFDLAKDTNYDIVRSKLEEIVKSNKQFENLSDMLGKSDDISKIVKKYKTPIQKIVYYRDILALFDGYLNEKMRISTKKALDSFEKELWSINDPKLRKSAEDDNSEVLKELGRIGSGRLIFFSRKEEISKEF
jgi:hypothetical protein